MTAQGGSSAATTSSALTGLQPEALWRHFEALTKIARPSGHEEHVIAHVSDWADERGFAHRQDTAHNVVVRVPATAGRESAPVVVLQGHLDMVCERLPDSPNDPAEGRIVLVRDGEWLTADGTTLGADDGVGVAAMMALGEDALLPHGPLELLMTVNEEVGGPNEGADGLDPSLISGRTLLNLDSEEDGKLTVGSASSTDTLIYIDKPRAACEPGSATLAVSVRGGLGGHSGVDIARGHADALKIITRTLRETLPVVSFRLVSLNGGTSLNAIPREATATCSLRGDDEAAFRAAVETAAATIRNAYAKTDPDLAIGVAPAPDAADAWTDEATASMLDLLAALPSGPLAMSPDFPGLVETSTSLDKATTDGQALTLQHLTRSSNAAALPEAIEELEAAAHLAGATFTVGQADPGWQPNLDSSVLATTRGVYERLFAGKPAVTAVHAWLETAVIGAKIPDLDMVSIGPQIEAPHSPDERVSIPTVERFWRLLTGVVDELSR